MEKETYKIREVVFGLRDEYRRIEKRLQKLQEYSKLAKNYDNLSFEVFLSELGYRYIYKGLFPLRLYRNEILHATVKITNNSYCSEYPLELTDEEKFNGLAKELLEDSFFRNIYFSNDATVSKVPISISSGCINIYPYNFSKILSISYCSNDDTISFNRKIEGPRFTKEDIETVLDCPISCDIPEYHKSIINRSGNGQKDINLVLDCKIKDYIAFKINDKGNEIVLQKTKKYLNKYIHI